MGRHGHYPMSKRGARGNRDSKVSLYTPSTVGTLILVPSLTIVAAVGNGCRACVARWISAEERRARNHETSCVLQPVSRRTSWVFLYKDPPFLPFSKSSAATYNPLGPAHIPRIRGGAHRRPRWWWCCWLTCASTWHL